MNKTKLMIVLAAGLVIVGVGASMMGGSDKDQKSNTESLGDAQEMLTDSDSLEAVTGTTDSAVKEFTMTAFYEMKDGKPAPQYSLNAISVKKGDTVRVKITNTKGMHDFVIDEYAIDAELPLNEEVVVEFKADKVGEFVYYCSKPGHRAGGQFGTLTVSE